jgi:hypothetical protein
MKKVMSLSQCWHVKSWGSNSASVHAQGEDQQRCNWCDACIGIALYWAFIASHCKSDAGPVSHHLHQILWYSVSVLHWQSDAMWCTLIWWHWFASLSDTMPIQCIAFLIRCQCSALLFQYNTNTCPFIVLFHCWHQVNPHFTLTVLNAQSLCKYVLAQKKLQASSKESLMSLASNTAKTNLLDKPIQQVFGRTLSNKFSSPVVAHNRT